MEVHEIQKYEELTNKPTGRELEKQSIQKVLTEKYPEKRLEKDAWGKPHISPKTLEINYSHSNSLLFWGEHPSLSIGVDVESYRPQILKIKDKFCNEIEQNTVEKHFNPLKSYTLIWSAKESMYKAYGKKEIDFKNQLLIQPFDPETESFLTAILVLDNQKHEFCIHYEMHEHFVVTWTVMSQSNF